MMTKCSNTRFATKFIVPVLIVWGFASIILLTKFQATDLDNSGDASINMISFPTTVSNVRERQGFHIDNSGDTSINRKQQQQQKAEKDLILSVPFFIYEEFDWLNSGTCNTSVSNFTLKEFIRLGEEGQRLIKEDSELMFYIAATNHPMRRERPEDAKLFLVPTLSTYIAWSVLYGSTDTLVCNNGVCSRDLLVQADNVLEDSKWFQRSQGSDHIVIMTTLNFDMRRLHLGKWHFRNLVKCNALLSEGGWKGQRVIDDNRIRFNTFYVSRGCPTVQFHKKKDDLALISTLFKLDKNGKKKKGWQLEAFLDRRNICDWINGTNTSEKKYSMSVCGRGKQCPTLSNARAGFHVRGDTWTANRLFDTLLSGTVPIFTREEQFSSHQSFIDWNMLAHFIQMGENGSNRTLFLQQLNSIVGDKKQLEAKTQVILENRDLFDWNTLVPFDIYMYMFQAHIWPHTRVNRSNYSVLILPPQLLTTQNNSEV